MKQFRPYVEKTHYSHQSEVPFFSVAALVEEKLSLVEEERGRLTNPPKAGRH